MPLLLKWLAYEPAPSRRNTCRLLKDFHFDAPYRSLQRQERRSANTVGGFRSLGSNALCVLPELNRIMTNSPSYEVSARARNTLAFMGDPAFPWLLTAFTNQWRYNYEIPETIAFMGRLGSDIRPAIPVMIAFLNDTKTNQAMTDSCVRALASLGHYRTETETIVAALIETTHSSRARLRAQAVVGLGMVGNPPDTGLPALINCMDDPDPQVASGALTVLPIFLSHADIVVPAIVKRLKTNDATRVRIQMDVLSRFGRRAQPAIPSLLEIMDHPVSPSVWIAASNALYRIDPNSLTRKPRMDTNSHE